MRSKKELNEIFSKYHEELGSYQDISLTLNLLSLKEANCIYVLSKCLEVSKNYIDDEEFVLWEYTSDWRGALAISTFVTLNNRCEHSEHLLHSIMSESFVAPQLAARLALIAPAKTIHDLDEWLREKNKESLDRKTRSAALTAIKLRNKTYNIFHEEAATSLYPKYRAQDEWAEKTLKDYELIKKFMVERNLYRDPDREENK